MVPIERVERPPRLVHLVQPDYPPDALRRRVRGLVVLRVLVSEQGIPLQVQVIDRATSGLTEAAEKAVRQWRFEPARAGGEAVRTWATVRIPFEAVPFATPTPSPTPPETKAAEAEAEAQPTTSPVPSTPAPESRARPTDTPAPPTPAATPIPTPPAPPIPTTVATASPAAPPARRLEAPDPVPPEPPSGEPGARGAVYRTRRSVRLAIVPEQARIWIDGRYVGIADDWDGNGGGLVLQFAGRGPHALHAELPGYRSLEAEIDVTPAAESASVDVEEELRRAARLPFPRLPRPVAATRRAVALFVDRADARVAVNGTIIGPASAFPFSAPLILGGPGVHELSVSAPGAPVRTLRVVVGSAAPPGTPVVRVSLNVR